MLRRLFERIRPTPDPDTDSTAGPALIVVGLGNPGSKYAKTRHNIGFMIVDRLAKDLPDGRQRERLQSILLETSYQGRRIVLAKPLTFMNRSGIAVDQIRQWYKIPLDHMLIVYDDLDLPFGRVRVRTGGGAGGHNGVSSIIESVGDQDFPRLRVGIGRPTTGTTINYVLQRFNESEHQRLPQLLDLGAEAVTSWVESGITVAMNEYNRRDLSPHEPESCRVGIEDDSGRSQ